jgi:alpha-maltose-1-phosphate synthase
MRVAYFCADPGIPAFGRKGASVHVQEMIRCWRKRGAAVTLYCTRRGDDVPADLADLEVVCRPVPRARGTQREAAQASAAAELARRVIDDGADVVYERYSLFSTALAQVTAALRIPGFLEVNSPLIDEQRTYRELHDEQSALRALAVQVAAAAKAVCVSEPIAAWVRRRAGSAAVRIAVVPNGVNVDRIRPGNGGRAGVPVVVFVGTLKPWHGVDVLIEATRHARQDWRLLIVGDGPQADALRAQAARGTGAGRGPAVEFAGAVAPERIPELLAGCAAAAAPYPATQEADSQYFSPLKLYEYCAAGLPVVASRVGQVPQIIDDGVTGLLVEPSDPRALAAAIDELVSAPVARAAMGAAARRIAVRDFGWDRVLDRILDGVPLDAKLPAGTASPAGTGSPVPA